MSLFQCQVCGCCENTALSGQGCDGFVEDFYNWTPHAEQTHVSVPVATLERWLLALSQGNSPRWEIDNFLRAATKGEGNGQ